jgi:hypothetical protein
MFGREPVVIAAAVRAIIVCAVAFGLKWTPEQIGATMLAVEAILAVITRQSVTPNQTVRDSFVKLPAAMMVALLGLGLMGCAKPPPNLTPTATRAFYATEAIKDFDRLREVAVSAHATTPPLLSTDETIAVVEWHKAAIITAHAAQSGWQLSVATGLDQALGKLTPSSRALIAPYVAIVRSVLEATK